MQRGSTYLLALLLVMSMGGAFHHHDEALYNFSNDPTVYLNSHHCSDHANHPDLANNQYCQKCSRITTSSIFEGEQIIITKVYVLDEVTPENTISYRSEDYLLLFEPRSPPFLA